MVHLLKKLIRWAKITKARDNSKKFATQQVSYDGKTGDCFIVFPYGLDANLPADDTLVAMLSINGDSENRAGIGWTPEKRLTLKEGEVGFYHPLTGVSMIYDESGNAVIDTAGATGNVTINAQDVNISAAGDINASAGGQAIINAPLVELGAGGSNIARLGDQVQIVIPGGSSAGTYTGAIITAGVNKSA